MHGDKANSNTKKNGEKKLKKRVSLNKSSCTICLHRVRPARTSNSCAVFLYNIRHK